jgi:hypothetical protein
MHYLKIYKTCLKWKIKNTIVEKLKLQIHSEHLWKNPKHDPFHFERAYLVHFPGAVFTDLDTSSGGLQNCYKFQKEQTMDKRVIMIQYLKCSVIGVFTLGYILAFFLGW